MRLLSVNVSLPREVPYNGTTMTTGIYKEPVDGRLMLRKTNLDGDGQADLKNHGGEDKAVYAFAFDHYPYWQDRLGRDGFQYGQFGENFTVEGMLEVQVHIGDVFRVGAVRVQVTQPRTPCYKLAHKMDESRFVKMFMEREEVGFYLRVLDEGEVGAGDPITLAQVDPVGVTVKEAFHLMHFDKANEDGLRRVLGVAGLSADWRSAYETLLEKQSFTE